MTDKAIKVKNLTVTFGKGKNSFQAVKNISYDIEAGKVLGIVGESGSGKSVSSLAIMGLLGENSKIDAEQIEISGIDFKSLKPKELRKHLGKTISIVFQDALNSLDPTYTIGQQLIEVLELHSPGLSIKEYKAKAIELLNQVGIKNAESRLNSYPHHLSGGMLQRIMIAIAISSEPKVLIADEPTTALDVIIQDQIVKLLLDIQVKKHMTLVFISHDLGLVSKIADKVIVMKQGQIVETGTVKEIFQNPKENYTLNLINSLPQYTKNLQTIDIKIDAVE